MYRTELTQTFLGKYSLSIGHAPAITSFIELMREYYLVLDENIILRKKVITEFTEKTHMSFDVFLGVLENLKITSFDVSDIERKGEHKRMHADLIHQINSFLFPSCEDGMSNEDGSCAACGGSACGNHPGER